MGKNIAKLWQHLIINHYLYIMAKYYCEYCGTSYDSVRALTACSCSRHPDGPCKGKHKLYEGSEKDKYTCKFCGTQFTNLRSMTACSCSRHPNGPCKGKHSPALWIICIWKNQ